MHHLKSHNSLSLNNHKMVNEEDITAALAEIELLEDLNYHEIVYKHTLIYIILLRRAKDLIYLKILMNAMIYI